MSQRGAGWRKAVGCARGRPSEGSAREACRVRSMSGQVAGPRGVGARGRCVKPRAVGGVARAVPRQSPRTHGDRRHLGAPIDRMPRAAHPRMASEQPKHPRCREIGVRGSPSRRFLRRGGVPIPPPSRQHWGRYRPAVSGFVVDRLQGRHARTGLGRTERASCGPSVAPEPARRLDGSAGRQGRACRSPAACVRSQTPRDGRARCRAPPDTHPGVEQGAHRYGTGSDAAAALWSASSVARCRERLLSIAVRRR